MKEITKHIKMNSFSRAYLLCGEEDYLKQTFKKKLLDATLDDSGMNYAYFEGKGIDPVAFSDAANTMPFFADYRVVVVENSGLFKSSSESFAQVVKDAPDTTIFIFVESDTDKRNKLYKLVKDVGYIAEMNKMTISDLKNWLGTQLKKAGKNIREADLNYLIEKVGLDMNTLKNETDKLIAYVGEDNIVTREHIDTITITQPEDKVFEMIDAMANQDSDRAFKLYADLLELKCSHMLILNLLGKQFEKLLKINDYLEEGKSERDIASSLSLYPKYAAKNIKQARTYGGNTLREAFTECVSLDAMLKSVNTRNDQVMVEALIVKYCTINR